MMVKVANLIMIVYMMMLMLMLLADVNDDVDDFDDVMQLMIDDDEVADDDDAGPAVGGDDGGSVILWEIPSLRRSDTGCVNSGDWKPSVLLDSLASVADPDDGLHTAVLVGEVADVVNVRETTRQLAEVHLTSVYGGGTWTLYHRQLPPFPPLNRCSWYYWLFFWVSRYDNVHLPLAASQ